jgi:hypothetical protein
MASWAEALVATSLRELQDRVRVKLGGKRGHYVYRGQAAGWSLSTSLERACADSGIELVNAGRLEQRLIREFKRRAHHYRQDVPEKGNQIEWVALMQHHGAPTRLLDWTYSLPVATYFALVSAFPAKYTENDGKERPRDAEVWMIDAEWCRHASIRKTGDDDHVLKDALQSSADEHRLAERLHADNRFAFVFPVNPFRLNERLTIQRGVFLYPGDVGQSFEENLRTLEGHENQGNVCRFRIPRENMQAMLEELQEEANISEATLFPGLDGFSRSLHRRLPFFLGQEEL